MAENFRRGDRVEWHNGPQNTADTHELKRAKAEHGSVREHIASDDGAEGSVQADHR